MQRQFITALKRNLIIFCTGHNILKVERLFE